MTTSNNDLERLKAEYKDRQIRLKDSGNYSTMNLTYLFMIQQRQRETITLMRKIGIRSLSQMRILEIGCGHGDVLYDIMYHRIDSKHLYGVEVLSNRLVTAKQRFPGVNLVLADGQKLPYAENQFDLVVQHTVLSSILDSNIKAHIAREMLRVVKDTDGVILWYDFWLNPTNPETKGIRKDEIKRLFPDCKYIFRRITLAPPLSRKLIPISWGLGLFLEKLIVLNTHYLVAIKPI